MRLAYVTEMLITGSFFNFNPTLYSRQSLRYAFAKFGVMLRQAREAHDNVAKKRAVLK